MLPMCSVAVPASLPGSGRRLAVTVVPLDPQATDHLLLLRLLACALGPEVDSLHALWIHQRLARQPFAFVALPSAVWLVLAMYARELVQGWRP